MHENFANWYQPVSFGHDRETLELRWNGIEQLLETVDDDSLQELIRLVYGSSNVSSDFLVNFRQSFKEMDSTFLTEGNDQEVLVLAGCLLAVLCLDYDMSETAPLILTASFFGNRKLLVDIDLIGMAEDRILNDGVLNRKRPLISVPEKNVPTETIMSDTLENLGSTIVTALDNMQKKMYGEIIKLQKTIKIQDEELQLLWWMIGQRSTMWDSSFGDMAENSRSILLAIEAANMTEEFTEPPSLKAIFSHVGISSNSKVTIPDAINLCGGEALKKIIPENKICSTIFPLHFAATRALETGVDTSWIAGWSNISGISKSAEFTFQQLALQIYRECKLISQLTISDS